MIEQRTTGTYSSAVLGCCFDVLILILGLIVLFPLQIVCGLNVASLSFFILFGDNTYNLSFFQFYLLAINSYALGFVLLEMVINPIRKNLGWNTPNNRDDDIQSLMVRWRAIKNLTLQRAYRNAFRLFTNRMQQFRVKHVHPQFDLHNHKDTQQPDEPNHTSSFDQPPASPR